MQAGRLRHRVAIERRIEVRDAGGDLVRVDWEVVKPSVPVEILPLSARELVAAQAEQSEVSVRVVMRWMPGLDASMRLRRLDDSRVYNIAGKVEDNRSGREWITVPVTEGVNEG